MKNARTGQRGDLLIRFIVDFPTALPRLRDDGTDDDRRAKLAPLLGGSPDPPAGYVPGTGPGGLFGGLFSSSSKPQAGADAKGASAVASRAPKARVDALYRRRKGPP